MTDIRTTTVESPIGPLVLAGDAASLTWIAFGGDDDAHRPDPAWREDDRMKSGRGPLAATARQLREYFEGRRRVFELPLAPPGTAFQLRVWNALQQIPYGETISYGELARRIGNPKASRAVGLANGSNPIPIVIPCHRVIGSDGSLVGFGGGLPIKRALLALERGQLSMI